jgi:hypothetical protein
VAYDVGGSGSLLEISAVASGFLRNIKKPTAMGIRIKMNDAHRDTAPIVVAAAGSLLPPILMSAPGTKLAKTEMAPKKHMNRPGQPHNTTAAIVAIIPFVFVSIFFSPLMN